MTKKMRMRQTMKASEKIRARKKMGRK